jgi:hypothetical protein
MSTLTVVLAVPTVVDTVVGTVVKVVLGVGVIGAGPTVKTPFMPAAA